MSQEQQSGARPAAESAVQTQPDLPGEPLPGQPPAGRGSRRKVLLAVLAAVALYVTWRSTGLQNSIASRDPASVLVAKPAPPFSLATLDGRTLSLRDFAGKKVVLSYWASWCGPCQVEMPELGEFYRRHHQRTSDFEILAISIDENPGEAMRYAAREKLPFPVLLDPESQTADAYSVAGIPTLFVIGKDGTVQYARTGLEEGIEVVLSRQLGIAVP